METNIQLCKLLFKQKKYKEAIEACNTILAKEPNSFDALKLKAKSLLATSQLDLARLYYNQALKLNPIDFELIKDLGNSYQAIGDVTIAKKYYQKALEINSSYAPALTNLGSIELKNTNKYQALSLLIKATNCDPKLVAAWGNLANGFLQLGKIKEAETACKKLIELNPNTYNSYLLLGTILIKQKKYKKAELYILKAIEINPHKSNSYYLLAKSLIDKKELKEAEIQLMKAIKINPDISEYFSTLGGVQCELNKQKEAEISLLKAIQINPNLAEANYNLGIIFKNVGKIKKAELFTRKAIELNSEYYTAHSNLGIILKDLGKLKEAELSTRKAIELKPKYAEAYSNLGIILKDLGKLKEAELSIRKAIELKPKYAAAYSNLGIILKDLGKLKEAQLSTRKAIELNPKYAEAYSNLGNILKDLGKSKEAQLSIRKAIELKPDFADAYLNLLSLLEAINDLESLQECLNQSINLKSIANEWILFSARLSFRNKEYKKAKLLIDQISSTWVDKSSEIIRLTYWSFRGFIEEKARNYDLAFSCFEKSQLNKSYKNIKKYLYLNYINDYKQNAKYKFENIKQIHDEINDYNLSFLIGFPRSGTTLLDTILRSHPDIEVVEEQPVVSYIEKLIQERLKIKLTSINKISNKDLEILRQQYYQLLTRDIGKDKNLIIDKLPLNTVSLPLINRLFPHAKIIFTHRHPYDTVLSCFQQLFAPNEGMVNLTSLKSSSQIYDQVMDAWDIYKKNLTFNYITSKYEDLIYNFDNHVLKILNFLEIEWHENVQNFRRTAFNRGQINTPSSSQVVQPLYKSSINKWKNYEKYFEDCHQYLQKWVNYFDY